MNRIIDIYDLMTDLLSLPQAVNDLYDLYSNNRWLDKSVVSSIIIIEMHECNARQGHSNLNMQQCLLMENLERFVEYHPAHSVANSIVYIDDKIESNSGILDYDDLCIYCASVLNKIREIVHANLDVIKKSCNTFPSSIMKPASGRYPRIVDISIASATLMISTMVNGMNEIRDHYVW